MPTPSPAEAALAAHQAALEAQARMTALARQRDQAVAFAIEEGSSAVYLAEQLGVTRQRIYAMARNVEEQA